MTHGLLFHPLIGSVQLFAVGSLLLRLALMAKWMFEGLACS